MTKSPGQIHDAPLSIVAEAGLVIVDDAGVAVTMMVDCAEETGRRLIAASATARGQTPRPAT